MVSGSRPWETQRRRVLKADVDPMSSRPYLDEGLGLGLTSSPL